MSLFGIPTRRPQVAIVSEADTQVGNLLSELDKNWQPSFLTDLKEHFFNSGETQVEIGKDVPLEVVTELNLPQDENKPGFLKREEIVKPHELEMSSELSYSSNTSSPSLLSTLEITNDNLNQLPEQVKTKYSLRTFYTFPENYCHGKTGKIRTNAILLITAARAC